MLPLFFGGCFTSAALRETKGYKSKDFYPDTIAWNQPASEFALVGVRSGGGKTIPCHVVVPGAVLLKLKSPDGEIRLSHLRKLSAEDIRRLHLVDGPPPAGFVDLAKDPASGVVINKGRKTFRPAPLLILPATLIIDVVTLPIAIPLLHSLDNVH